jgi:Na+/alanine symporter
MDKFMEALYNGVVTINTYLSNYVLIILLVGVGLYFTIRTKFVQLRCLGEGMKNVFGNISLRGEKSKGGMSSFQALATSIAAQVGTGNIVGACGAILVGGPGAIFWMWIIAFLGMATIYAEAVLAQKTRVVNADGSIDGGPVYYIKTAFKGKFGKFFDIIIVELRGYGQNQSTIFISFHGQIVRLIDILYDDSRILRGHLCTVFPVYFIPVIFLRIMACRNHNACNRIQ